MVNLSAWGSCSQSVVPGPAPSASQGHMSEMQIVGPIPDLLNSKLWGEPKNLCLTNPAGDPDTH